MKNLIDLNNARPILAGLGFPCKGNTWHRVAHKDYPSITVRPSRSYRYHFGTPSLIFEVEGRDCRHGGRSSALSLTVRDLYKCQAAFSEWLPKAIARAGELELERENRRTARIEFDKACAAYEAVGFSQHLVLHNEFGRACGVEVRLRILGTPEECARKLALMEEIK